MLDNALQFSSRMVLAGPQHILENCNYCIQQEVAGNNADYNTARCHCLLRLLDGGH